MKLLRPLRRLWAWLPPQTWTEVYAVIWTLVLLFLAVVYLADWLKAVLVR
ncbi:hypothetical protein ES703_41076 [subsurface metagenome]